MRSRRSRWLIHCHKRSRILPMEYAIETQNLRKVFGDRAAVKSLTLQVPQGEVFGFLGPNGAGKTTSIKMLLGLITPSSGSGRLLGAPVGERATLARIGFLPEHFRFQDWLTGREFLQLHGQLYGIEPGKLARRIGELLERVGLAGFQDKLLRTFSKGMMQRIGLAQALLNEPELVFLDEPTSGLDPVGRLLVRDMIRELRQGGTTVFLNSHLLSEIEITCNRVAFIRHGEVIRALELDTLDENQSHVKIRAGGLTPQLCSGLEQWGENVRLDGDRLALTIRSEAALPEITRFLVAGGAEIYAIIPERRSLEEIFIETVGKDGGL
jgi:ABC-2 type transport system ATP-binding protein